MGESVGKSGTKHARFVLGGVVIALAAFAAPAFGQDCNNKNTYAYMPRPNDKPERDTGQSLGAFRLLIDQAGSAGAGRQVSLETAKNGCEGLLKANGDRGKRNIGAQACFADATALVASDAKTRDIAHCAYEAVHQMAAKELATYAKDDAKALEGQAKLWVAKSNFVEASRAYEKTIAAYEAAKLPVTHDLLIAWAAAQEGTPDRVRALATYERLFTFEGPNFDSRRKAEIRRKQIGIVGEPTPSNSAELKRLWGKVAEHQASAEAHYNIGLIEFKDGKWEGARKAFVTAVASNLPANTPQEISSKNDAHYRLALLDARELAAMDPRNARASGRWNDVYSNANKAGAGAAAGQLACIAFLAQGNRSLLQREYVPEASKCTNDNGTPEARLLQGLYGMRRAQFMPDWCTTPGKPPGCEPEAVSRQNRKNYLDDAVRAFNEGKERPGAAGSFDWLDEKKQPLPPVADLLQAAKEMALSAAAVVNDQCSVLAPQQSLQQLFRTLDLMRCRVANTP